MPKIIGAHFQQSYFDEEHKRWTLFGAIHYFQATDNDGSGILKLKHQMEVSGLRNPVRVGPWI